MIRFIDLFAGTGGIRLAFQQACDQLDIQYQCVLSSEIDKQACASYELNFGDDPFRDIRTITKLPDHDMLLAGFPCQTFSYAGKRAGFGDTRGTLFFEVERILELKRPKYFMLENVRGLTSHDKGRTFKTIIESLTRLGYGVQHFLLNSSSFDVPQNRVRIYIVGMLGDSPKTKLTDDLGAPDTHAHRQQTKFHQTSIFDTGIKQSKVVADILETNPDEKYICSTDFTQRLSRVVGDDFTKLHGVRLIDFRGGNSIHSWELGIKGECTPEEINFMNLLISNRRKKKFGVHQDGKSLTKEQIETFFHDGDFEQITHALIEKGYLSCKEGRYNPVSGNMSFEVFKFLDPDSISITLTASDANRLGIVQNNVPRRITPRECARLQGYPDSYQLLENDNAVYKQMGNAVSVPVVKAVLLDFLKNNHSLAERKNRNSVQQNFYSSMGSPAD